METLPRVASNFYSDCTKCETETYHKVLTHVDDVTAQLECEICKKKKKYKLSTAEKKTKAKKKTSTRKRNTHKAQYEELVQNHGESPQPYNMKVGYKEHSAIDHPKFGLGIVTEAMSRKISVCFEDQVRELIHNRS